MSDNREISMNDELPGMMALAQGVAKQQWPHTMDAQVWATEFCKLFHPVASDLSRPAMNTSEAEGLMIGWFANAIMAGYDTANLRRDAESMSHPALDSTTG